MSVSRAPGVRVGPDVPSEALREQQRHMWAAEAKCVRRPTRATVRAADECE